MNYKDSQVWFYVCKSQRKGLFSKDRDNRQVIYANKQRNG